MRLIACPACRRHVELSERACPFCGHVGLTASAPSRLSMVLLGLCLAGCASSNKDDPAKAEDDAPQPAQPEPAQPEPTPEPAQPEPEQPQPTDTAVPDPGGEPNDSAYDPETPPVEGTDAGAEIEDKPVIDNPPQKTKYGGPRPQKKYGAPPPPLDL